MHVEVTLYHLYAGVPVLVNTPRGTVGVVFEPRPRTPCTCQARECAGPNEPGISSSTGRSSFRPRATLT